jgi:hypothetical protein
MPVAVFTNHGLAGVARGTEAMRQVWGFLGKREAEDDGGVDDRRINMNDVKDSAPPNKQERNTT